MAVSTQTVTLFLLGCHAILLEEVSWWITIFMINIILTADMTELTAVSKYLENINR